ncbi:adenylosuccinate lyase [uncultured Planktosalinus sp.]|uniref:adenylosuccinate lyase n=1 Tax=uncultured Planktosalinus sp. TaxID=1810935 RepID=UPI0030DAC9FE
MSTLQFKLKNLKAYRKDRKELANLILNEPDLFKQLLDLCFKFDDAISYKAAWVLEMVCLENIKLLIPHLHRFFDNLPKVHKHQAVRPMAKICEKLTLHFYSKKTMSLQIVLLKKQREQLTEICFDWLITNQKVAAKAYAMQCLFLLGTEFKWIHPELKILLNKDFQSQQPAFKSRAKNILNKLEV